MHKRVRRAAIALVLFGVLLQAPVVWALGRLIPGPAVYALVLSVVGINVSFLYRRIRYFRKSWLAPWHPAVDVPFFSWWFGCLFFLIGWPLVALAAWLLEKPSDPALGGLALAAFGSAALEVILGARRLRVRRLSVPIAGLPAAFDGFRIVQLSDIHVGDQVRPERVAAWVRRASELGADLIALTGDYIAHGTHYHQVTADVLGDLRARHGVVAALGNHDYFGDGDALAAALEHRGIRVLRNSGFLLEHRGATVYVAGVDDTWSERDDLHRALAGRPAGVPALLLAHDPDLFDAAAAAGVELVLSGHTHGGQVALPGVPRWANLAWLMSRYVAGRYRRGRSTLYVSRGVGTTALPLRIAVPPELVEITLRPA